MKRYQKFNPGQNFHNPAPCPPKAPNPPKEQVEGHKTLDALGALDALKLQSQDFQDDYEERAAILQFDAPDIYHTRAHAEAAAFNELKNAMERKLK